MGYGAVLLLFICLAFSLMMLSPLGNNSTGFLRIQNSTVVMQSIQTNSSTGGSTVGTFNLLNTVQIAKGFADYLGSLTGVIWDIFGSMAGLPDNIKTFIIAVLLLFITIAAVALWLGRSGD